MLWDDKVVKWCLIADNGQRIMDNDLGFRLFRLVVLVEGGAELFGGNTFDVVKNVGEVALIAEAAGEGDICEVEFWVAQEFAGEVESALPQELGK